MQNKKRQKTNGSGREMNKYQCKIIVYYCCFLTVRLGDTFEFIFFLDSVRIGWSLGSIDEFISQALGNRFDVAESSVASSSAQQPNCLVHSSQRRYINSLTSHGTGSSDTCRVFTWSTVYDCSHKNLKNIRSTLPNQFQSLSNKKKQLLKTCFFFIIIIILMFVYIVYLPGEDCHQWANGWFQRHVSLFWLPSIFCHCCDRAS